MKAASPGQMTGSTLPKKEPRFIAAIISPLVTGIFGRWGGIPRGILRSREQSYVSDAKDRDSKAKRNTLSGKIHDQKPHTAYKREGGKHLFLNTRIRTAYIAPAIVPPYREQRRHNASYACITHASYIEQRRARKTATMSRINIIVAKEKYPHTAGGVFLLFHLIEIIAAVCVLDRLDPLEFRQKHYSQNPWNKTRYPKNI